MSRCLILSLAGIAGLPSLGGCDGGDRLVIQPELARHGRLELGLSAEHDGVVYHLEASFDVSGPMSLLLQSTPDEDSSSASLPPGTYRVGIQPGFRLLEETDEGLNPVQAELVSPAEREVEVAPAATTRVAYRFSVDGEVVDLTPGTLEIGFEIEPSESCDGPFAFTRLAVPASPGASPNDVRVADLDGDGRSDLVFAAGGSPGLAVSFNQGSMRFSAPVALVAEESDSLDTADLDGDGDIDLAFSRIAADAGVLLNAGSGNFDAARDLATCYDPNDVLAVDLDGDGAKDLALACVSSSSIAVVLNAGRGEFVVLGVFPSFGDFPTGASPLDLAAGDVDADGDLDLVVANRDADAVSVLANAGDGRLSPAQTFPARFPTSVVLADVNGDGAIDLGWTNGGGNSLEIRLGGSAEFGEATLVPVGADPFSVAGGDLDGDGDVDLAVANGTSNDVSVLVNSGDGRFEPAMQYAVSLFPRDLAVADVDADGDLDLVTADVEGGQLSLLVNQRCATR